MSHSKTTKKGYSLYIEKWNPKAKKVGKIILILLGLIVGAFVLYILFGLFLISLGY